jgi:hypothetical protein
MRKLIILFFGALFFSCNQHEKKEKSKVEIIKRYNYLIDIEVWNSFAGDKAKYLVNNTRIGRYDSIDARFNILKPLTLYKISYLQEADKSNPNVRIFVPKDTLKVPFPKHKCDKLFDLTLRFFKSIEFNVYDTAVNGVITKPVLFDDSQARIGLSYGGKRMDVTISSISNPSITTKEFHTLLQYIQSLGPNPTNDD